ncbi:MAG: hypothetical protein Q4D80_05955, partial [Pseudomonadota bacterium]|nr:hypothetical protein [Pseudomonadota bacterium]
MMIKINTLAMLLATTFLSSNAIAAEVPQTLTEITKEEAETSTAPVITKYTKNDDNTLTEKYYKVGISEVGSGDKTIYYKWIKEDGTIKLIETSSAEDADITVKYGKTGRMVYNTQTFLSGNVNADFIGIVNEEASNPCGGTIVDAEIINNITGDFVHNNVQLEESTALGGAIFIDENGAEISEILN